MDNPESRATFPLTSTLSCSMAASNLYPPLKLRTNKRQINSTCLAKFHENETSWKKKCHLFLESNHLHTYFGTSALISTTDSSETGFPALFTTLPFTNTLPEGRKRRHKERINQQKLILASDMIFSSPLLFFFFFSWINCKGWVYISTVINKVNKFNLVPKAKKERRSNWKSLSKRLRRKRRLYRWQTVCILKYIVNKIKDGRKKKNDVK